MIKKGKAIVLFALLFCFAIYTQADASESKRYIVGFTEKIELDVLDGNHIHRLLPSIDAVAVELTEEEANEMKQNEKVAFIEKDERMKMSNQVVDWGITHIGVPQAWEHGLTGKGVKVAILDTGVYGDHPDLHIKKSSSFIDYTNSSEDDNGHGTHVAGIIGAQNNDIGIKGIAHNADIYVAKVLDANGDGLTSDVIKAIEWALDEWADIINISMGGNRPSAALEKALDDAYNRGALIVAAAGNFGNAVGTGNSVDYPATYDSVIAVAAVDQNDERAWFSATGKEVEVAAPGVHIWSTYLNGEYAYESGTSMAAPHVAGHLALLKEAYPDATNKELRQKLQEQTIDLGMTGRDPLYGFGRIQIPSDLKPEHKRLFPPKNVRINEQTWNGDEAELIITWQPPEKGIDVSKYKIERNQQLITTVEGTTYVDTVPEGTHIYTVISIDEHGAESEKKTVTVSVKQNKDVEVIDSFSDITGDEWYATAIYDLAQQGIIRGFVDETVRPNETITRQDAAVMMTRALQVDPAPFERAFLDVRSQSYAATYIQAMTNEKIIQGYGDGSFRPHNPINRGEVATMLIRAFTFEEAERVYFPDVEQTYFAYDDIARLAGANIAEGLPDGTFQPLKQVTRAEFAMFLARCLQYEQNKSTTKIDEAA